MKKASKDATSANCVSREFREGSRANNSAGNPYDPESAQHRAWLEGFLSAWDRGIVEINKGLVSEAAAALGRRNRGGTKTISQGERLRRSARLAHARKFRWGPPPCV